MKEQVKSKKKASPSAKKELQDKELIEQKIIKELSAIAFTNMSDLCTWTTEGLEVLDSSTLSPELLTAVAEVNENSKGKVTSLKLYPKIKALEMLAKHFGILQTNEDTPNNETEEDAVAKFSQKWEQQIKNSLELAEKNSAEPQTIEKVQTLTEAQVIKATKTKASKANKTSKTKSSSPSES